MNIDKGFIRPHHTKLAFLYKITDALFVLASIYLACYILGVDWQDRYRLIGLLAVVAFYVFSLFNDLYRSWRIASIPQELTRLWIAWLGATFVILLLWFIFLPDQSSSSRDVLALWFVMTPVILSILRVFGRYFWRSIRSHGHNSRAVAIVGLTDIGHALEDSVFNATWMGLRFHGYYDDRHQVDGRTSAHSHNTVLLKGNIDQLVEDARNGVVDMIYITFPLRAESRVHELVNRLSDTTVSVYFALDFSAFDLLHAHWYTLGNVPLVSIYENPFYGVNGWLKRVEDVVLSSIILAIILLPMLMIAVAVKQSSPGPVIFKQRRYGIDGDEIEVWKFRSMGVCEDGDDVPQAQKNDPRVTPVGAFLRRTSLDELPQFINVLQGRMSIVGPRPHAVSHNEKYRKLIHRYMLRHKVKPGITGWAQVNGWRGETDTLDKMEMRIQYDLEYIRKWTLLFDLQIIYSTVFSGFLNKNAY